MNLCNNTANATIGRSAITWAEAESNALHNFTGTSYLRPDTGGALIPWIHTVVVTIIHLPVVIIRVVRWEIVQFWCLVFTFITTVVYPQAAPSTQFDPAKVLVWTPVILFIDAGSMLQVLFLIIEAKKAVAGNQIVIVEVQESSHRPQERRCDGQNIPASQYLSNVLARFQARRFRTSGSKDRPITLRNRAGSINMGTKSQRALWCYRDPTVYTATIAILLFVAVFVLQLIGLVNASRAVKASSTPPRVQWSSPLFQPFGKAVIDGNCNVYDVNQSVSKDIGRIKIPGVWQQQWLKGTVIGTSIELVLGALDLLILSLVNGTAEWRGIKMKRRWGTIFSGLIVLIITLFYRVIYALELPPTMTQRVTVVMHSQAPTSYMANLTNVGLRGTIFGWNDGFFNHWQATYFGYWHSESP